MSEQQQSAALRRVQRLLGAEEAVAAQPVVIHAAFEINRDVTKRGNVPVPSPIRFSV
jgi:hypothetical protein